MDDRLSTLLFAAEQAVDIAVEAMLRGRVHVKALIDKAFRRKHRDTNRLRFAVIEELVRRSMRLRLHGSVLTVRARGPRRRQHRPYGTRSCR